MTKRPLSIPIISWFFIIFGAIALVGSLLPLFATNSAIVEIGKHWMVYLARALAIVSGVFMLSGRNWARWLLVVWFAFHIIISFMHSPFEVVMHVVFEVVFLFFLFRAPASAYFKGKSA